MHYAHPLLVTANNILSTADMPRSVILRTPEKFHLQRVTWAPRVLCARMPFLPRLFSQKTSPSVRTFPYIALLSPLQSVLSHLLWRGSTVVWQKVFCLLHCQLVKIVFNFYFWCLHLQFRKSCSRFNAELIAFVDIILSFAASLFSCVFVSFCIKGIACTLMTIHKNFLAHQFHPT